jgi:GNAT superfamily N-acetyltransferase
MEDIRFIRAAVQDAEMLRGLSCHTFVETYEAYNTKENMAHYLETEFSLEKLVSDISSPDSAFYFAMQRETAIGYIKINFARVQTDVHDPHSLELERIYVLKSWQGNKAGQFLLEGALQVARDNGLNYLWLGVWDKNTGARQFYDKNGFMPFGTHIFMLGDDRQTDILLKRSL